MKSKKINRHMKIKIGKATIRLVVIYKTEDGFDKKKELLRSLRGGF